MGLAHSTRHSSSESEVIISLNDVTLLVHAHTHTHTGVFLVCKGVNGFVTSRKCRRSPPVNESDEDNE